MIKHLDLQKRQDHIRLLDGFEYEKLSDVLLNACRPWRSHAAHHFGRRAIFGSSPLHLFGSTIQGFRPLFQPSTRLNFLITPGRPLPAAPRLDIDLVVALSTQPPCSLHTQTTRPVTPLMLHQNPLR
jgi:hypothetical protein